MNRHGILKTAQDINEAGLLDKLSINSNHIINVCSNASKTTPRYLIFYI